MKHQHKHNIYIPVRHPLTLPSSHCQTFHVRGIWSEVSCYLPQTALVQARRKICYTLSYHQDSPQFIRPVVIEVHCGQEPVAQCSCASVFPTATSCYLMDICMCTYLYANTWMMIWIYIYFLPARRTFGWDFGSWYRPYSSVDADISSSFVAGVDEM